MCSIRDVSRRLLQVLFFITRGVKWTIILSNSLFHRRTFGSFFQRCCLVHLCQTQYTRTANTNTRPTFPPWCQVIEPIVNRLQVKTVTRYIVNIMTLWNGSDFCIIGPLWGCYVAICDRRNLWRVSQIVTESVAICDNVKTCNLMTYIHSISINILFFHLFYTNVRLISRVCP